jgi:aryl-alcohol dehydrogenase-like predicted oxidoreductase
MEELRRRRLGKTGLVVTELGLGAMDTPHSPDGPATIAAALDLGIDFIDTAREYEGSEYLIGHVLRERTGSGVHLATKTLSRTADGSQWDVDRSLRVLGVERIAHYQLHDVSTLIAWEEVMGENGALVGLQTARYRGLIESIGISSHSTEVLRLAIMCGEFDAVMLEYSAFFTETAPLVALAAERDIGVIAMRPLGGSGRTSVMRGRVADGYRGPLTPANLLRYVLSTPGVSVAIPGARHPARIRENVATALGYEPMSDTERGMLEEEAASLY